MKQSSFHKSTNMYKSRFLHVPFGNLKTNFLRKNYSGIFYLLFLPVILSSCLSEGYNTLILTEKNKMDDVIPVEYRISLEESMPIYNGDTPPLIEGTYFISTHTLVSSSLSGDTPGKEYMDKIIRYRNQDMLQNILSFDSKEGTLSFATSDSVYIVGSGNDFTTYFVSEGYSYDVYTKTANILSGTITSSGIQNYYYAFVMLEKGSDPDEEVVDVGTYRVFYDSDGLSENTSWDKSALISSGIIETATQRSSTNK
jgi:hypothetical protein